MSYYPVGPVQAGNGTFIVFFPETRSVSGTKIMAEYISVKWLAHPHPWGCEGGGEGRSGDKHTAGKKQQSADTQNTEPEIETASDPHQHRQRAQLGVRVTDLHFEHEGNMPRTAWLPDCNVIQKGVYYT